MAIKMKALRTFRGRGIEGRPKKGTEFETEHQERAVDLERLGLAVPLAKALAGAPQNKMEDAPSNKARPSHGGLTGQGKSPSSSPVVPPQRAGKPMRQEGKPE